MSDPYEVFWPGGAKQGAGFFYGRAADPLTGRKIAFVWNNIFNGDVLWRVVREELGADNQVEFVDSDEFGNFMGPHADEVLEALPERLRRSGVDSVIVGMGA